ncbi:MAG: type IV toxin-antitoxin system AbiEi family antitoxin [Bacteroidales bacterium]|nr:type IV toxin-antitoxin system AbiEi family antitoxin [Bacteroidales bacterium]
MVWTFRNTIPDSLLQSTNAETGVIKYSNPELTSVDLVQYNKLIGGLSVAATVLAELVEVTNFSRNATELLNATTLPTLQRLGYILDVILDEQDKADQIKALLSTRSRKVIYRPLQTDLPVTGKDRDKKWKIIINQDIEPDSLW